MTNSHSSPFGVLGGRRHGGHEALTKGQHILLYSEPTSPLI